MQIAQANSSTATADVSSGGGLRGNDAGGSTTVSAVQGPALKAGPFDGELWWIFQSVDSAVERFVEHVDTTVGDGHGHRVLKLILLGAPIFVGVFVAAFYVITGGGVAIRSDIKRI